MKVLQISTYKENGGAGIAASRLHDALIERGVGSIMLVSYSKNSEINTVTTNFFKSGYWAKLSHVIRHRLDDIPQSIFYRDSSGYFSNNIVPSRIREFINKIAPDVIHLHWINDGFFPLSALEGLNIPIVWSFHDMWGLTGGCHYTEGCEKWRSYCERCHILRSEKDHDLSFANFTKKLKSMRGIKDLTIIGLSSWMEDCCRSSPIYESAKIIRIPNCIDVASYACYDKISARCELGLDPSLRYVFYGAQSATTDPRKGFDLLSEAVNLLSSRATDVRYIVVGGEASGWDESKRFLNIGKVSDSRKMNLLLSASNLSVCPSRQENLSNMIVESAASGTPVVAFAIGGNGDIIEHKRSGYLAKPFDVNDLAAGIEWVLQSGEALGIRAREFALAQFDTTVVADRYIDLYSSLSNSVRSNN